jgi:4-hydroxy-2-oxoheptanedioate aldolase
VKQNPLPELWKQDRTAYTCWLSIPGSWSAEVMAHAGFDAVVVDLQHGLAGNDAMLAMLQAIGTTAAAPIVRVPWNEPSAVMRALDAGAYGIICPMVNTRAQCEALVAACRFPPEGSRSFGPTRSLVSIGPDYLSRSRSFALAFAMIETAEALANLDAIAGVPGLDGLFIGPWDLSLALGIQRAGNLADPAMVEACDRILAAARKHGLVAGIYADSAAQGRPLAARGFRLVNVATDTMLLQRGAEAELAQARA